MIQDGQVQVKAAVADKKTVFVATYAFDLEQCPEIANAALSLDHDVRVAIHESLGIAPPEFKPLPNKIVQN